MLSRLSKQQQRPGSLNALKSASMSTTLESKVVFRARALSLGVTNNVVDLLAANGWATLGSYGYSCGWVPGATDDAAFKLDVLTPVLGSPVHPWAAPLRRLDYEAYSMSAADLRSKLERTATDPPRAMPAPEREQRLALLQQAIPGTLLRGPQEPANSMVDMLSQCLETGTLKYLSWLNCPSRDRACLCQSG